MINPPPPPQMNTLGWSAEMLGRERNSTGLCNHLNKTMVGSETRLILGTLKFDDYGLRLRTTTESKLERGSRIATIQS